MAVQWGFAFASAVSEGHRLHQGEHPGGYKTKGFFNASVDGGDVGTYMLDDARDAQGIAYESEVVADATGFASITETAKWGRNKVRPLRNELLAVWSFEKTAEGFYRPGSLVNETQGRTSSLKTGEPVPEVAAACAAGDEFTVDYVRVYDFVP